MVCLREALIFAREAHSMVEARQGTKSNSGIIIDVEMGRSGARASRIPRVTNFLDVGREKKISNDDLTVAKISWRGTDSLTFAGGLCAAEECVSIDVADCKKHGNHQDSIRPLL